MPVITAVWSQLIAGVTQKTYRGTEYQIEFIPKIKIAVIIPEDIEDSESSPVTVLSE
jgi:nitrogen regulatory protein PII